MFSDYRPLRKDAWIGRVDDPEDYDSFRWHQIIESIDLSQDELEELSDGTKGYCFLGFCCDTGIERNQGRIGASKGPSSIRKEMANLSCSFSKDTRLLDAGDIYCTNKDLSSAQVDLSEAVRIIRSKGYFPIVLGGGHELAFGHYSGIVDSLMDDKTSNQQPRELSLGIINFDAHLDLRPYENGPNSGSMFTQISDSCQDKDIRFSYMCIGVQKYGNTVSLFKRADELGVNYIFAKDISENTLHEIKDRIVSFLDEHEHIYLTICTDVISSAYAPGVSSPQPFGLLPETALTLIKQVAGSKKVASVDIAEVSPRFDEDNRTAKLAAIMVYAIVTLRDGVH
ncbi:MAG: formimidoylglutamase [Candidatus Thorarchaeota archaeon]|nr:formimidoylglutamase [Candidatus Thorarchaeota archaeon]